jgi:uncharacterized protein (TIGR02145 family)
LVYKENQVLENGSAIEVEIGNAGIYFLTISTPHESRTFKASGALTGGSMSIAMQSGTAIPLKSGHVYTLNDTGTKIGDNVKVMVFKGGYVAQPVELIVSGDVNLVFPLEAQTPPQVQTLEATNILSNSATLNGNVVSGGNSPISERGFYWSATNQTPGEADSIVIVDGSTGSFSTELTGLNHATTYYVRAYAINEIGTSYGEQISFTTLAILPTVTTTAITNITQTTATSGGNVTSDGGASITERGFYWSATNENPGEADSIIKVEGSTGSFSAELSGLELNTSYYLRAYAINNMGMAYGEQMSFTTEMWERDIETAVVYVYSPETGKVWMDRNLGATRAATSRTDTEAYGDLYQWGRAADGHQKRNSQTISTLSSGDTPGHRNFIKTNSSHYDWRSTRNDNLWQGVNGINNPCPRGYRVPTSGEWAKEFFSWRERNTTGAFNSPLKLPAQGERTYYGAIIETGSMGGYWTSTISGNKAHKTIIYASSGNPNTIGTYTTSNDRVEGYSVRCIMDFESQTILPIITTTGITNITQTIAKVGGNVNFDGGASVTARGVVWGLSQNPTLQSSMGSTNNGTGMGSFTSTLAGLQANTTYYVRTYATNSQGTAYGQTVEFTTLVITWPTATTIAINTITTTSAISGGNISSDGGAPVTARGVCWSTSQNLTIADSKTTDGTDIGTFTSSITGLTANTTYYVRAYATNSQGTSYGNVVQFTTDTQTAVVDVTNPATGRTWMDRNLGATRAAISSTDTEAYGDLYQWGRAADGHQKRNSPTSTTLSSSDTPGHGSFITTGSGSNNDWRSPQNTDLWQGVNGTNNPCPSGYRLPTIAELDAERKSWSNNNAAGAFASPLKLPVAGRRYYDAGALGNVSSFGIYWSSTVYGSDLRVLYFLDSSASTYYSYYRAYGNSVRCIKDVASQASLPTLTTTSIASITQTTATSGGNVTSDGGATVTDRGVCWNTTGNPTIANSKTTNGTGAGTFTSSLTGLAANTTYYVRAYATNSQGAAYGEQISFTTTTAITVPTVTTASISNITQTTASGGGNVTSDGGATVNALGVCWNTTGNPTIANSKTTNGTGSGTFMSNITGLTANTTYYVRAYATNSQGTAYGEQKSFTTSESISNLQCPR